MQKLTMFLLALISLSIVKGQQQLPPDKIYGALFEDVQMQKIFPDRKTFVDCVPKRKKSEIMADCNRMKGPDLDLKKFVEDNFELPATPQLNYVTKEQDAATHIKNLWPVLKHNADKHREGSSLLPLPYPYIVPGGRFREIYYWDSYFTMLGLKESGEITTIENIVKNFAFLINKYGHIPNGNRSYYLTRSQPPFFCMMVQLLAGIKGNSVYKTFLPAMEKEYAYWMEGADKLKAGAAYKRVVKMQDGSIMNRYWDDGLVPRQESFKEDHELAEAVAFDLAKRIKVASPEILQRILRETKEGVYSNLRAGAASGWDFSSRWFTDEANLATIKTTTIVPVDLNCLLYSMENIIATAKRVTGNKTQAVAWQQKATKRKAAVLKFCWNESVNFFTDYRFEERQKGTMITAAGLFPLFVKIATTDQANKVSITTEKELLKDGGIVTTNNHTGQQWDAPNGWAPLQWVSIAGLDNYGQTTLAKTIAHRWLVLNDRVFSVTGKMMEKYNVEDMSKTAGGGEYPSQDGFGWTNGVYLALKAKYPGE